MMLLEVTNTSTTFVNLINDETLLNLRQEVLDLQNQFGTLSTVIEELQKSTEDRLSNIPEQANDTDRQDLLKDLDDLRDYQRRLSTIQTRHRDCLEAGSWLSKKREPLIRQVINDVKHNLVKTKIGQYLSNPTFVRQFFDDIDVYIRWIGHHLVNGTEPEDFPKGLISLIVPSEIYRQVFLEIRNNHIAPSKSGLSTDAANMLASYINIYLLERDITADA